MEAKDKGHWSQQGLDLSYLQETLLYIEAIPAA